MGMNVNDIVYLVYDSGTNGTAFKVKLLTPFVTNNKPIYRGGGPVCTADYLLQYGFDTGWRTPEESLAAGERDFSGHFRVQKRNLYPTWEEAKKVLNRRLEARIKAQIYCVEYAQKQLADAHHELTKATNRLAEAQAFDFSNFSETSVYISPFTGETK